MFGFLARLLRRRRKEPPVHVEPVFATPPAEPSPPLPPRAAAAPAPEPFAWRPVGVCPVGGLRSLGFAAGGDVLLIVSEHGRIVVDALTSVQLARDPMRYFVGQERGEALGIGPLAGQVIRVAGLFGGRLDRETADGWSLAGAAAATVLVAPDGTAFGVGARPDTVIAGFSPTGSTLVVADAAEVALYGRA
jgi:hypothetical protein